MRLKIYTASKLNKAEMWRELNRTWPFEFTARWFKYHVGKVPDSSAFAKMFWQEDEEDIKRADVVLVYAEEEDKLRGALVEAGMAIAYNIPVIVVGEHEDFGTWSFHPLVYRVSNMNEALIFLEMMQNAKMECSP